ncbi:hypothetical protein [Nostoc sp. C117]|uniref:hypothetical protein n=1 Tax=Nostoc sp. C117 TaxID=3349875 RepID=UPI00370D6694
MNNFAKALVLALMFAAPVAISVPAVQAATTHKAHVKSGKIHHTKHTRHHKRHLKNQLQKPQK